MTDCFALLEQPRQPWLDPEILREKFLELSTRVHPDRVATADESARQDAATRFASLNAAYQTLRDPKSRVGHLLELETGAPPGRVEQVTGTFADLFFQVSALCRQVDVFLASRHAATSPMVKAGLYGKGLEWLERLQQQQGALAQRTALLEEELQSMTRRSQSENERTNPASSSTLPVQRLEEIYRSLSYLARWNAQTQERLVQLSI